MLFGLTEALFRLTEALFRLTGVPFRHFAISCFKHAPFVLATDAVGGVSEMDPRRCIVLSPTMMWAPDKGRAKSMTYTNTQKRLLTKKIY